jgi:hypothetical protein
MAAQGFIQNGARVFIASRKESELKKVNLKLRYIFVSNAIFCRQQIASTRLAQESASISLQT